MAGEIRLSAPEEVKAQVMRAAALLALYHEGLEEEARQLNSLSSQLESTRQALNHHRGGLESALESAKAQGEQSEAARRTQSNLEKRLAACEAQLQTLGQCGREYETICQDMSGIRQRCQQLADGGKLLSTKVGQLLDKIIELK